jgi:hypothetical protein
MNANCTKKIVLELDSLSVGKNNFQAFMEAGLCAMLPCSLVGGYQSFGVIHCSYIQNTNTRSFITVF